MTMYYRPTSQPSTQLRLYVWHEFACDYTCGIAFAIAQNEEEAKDVILGRSTSRYTSQYTSRYIRTQLDNIRPEVFELNSPVGFYVEGGS